MANSTQQNSAGRKGRSSAGEAGGEGTSRRTVRGGATQDTQGQSGRNNSATDQADHNLRRGGTASEH
jgi:hypothetical protein